MKSLMLLCRTVLNELGDLCGVSTMLDLKKIEHRVEHEGLSFLTITLPDFCSDFQKSLDVGRVDRDLFTSFQWRGGFPLFLGGFLDLVFDRVTGRLLDSPSTDSIFSIRQFTLLFGKIELECSDERQLAAVERYLECESSVRDADRNTSSEALAGFRRVSALLWAQALSDVDLAVYSTNILVPKHGPGKTADRIRGNAKFDQSVWTKRLESEFPFGEFAIPSWRYRYLHDRVVHLEPGEEKPVKVILVPKTLKTPRVIALEPTCMQYTQQALLEQLMTAVERGSSPATGVISFTDQTLNQRMAQEGSLSGEFATLDLSEASDRVSNQLVRTLLTRFPHLARAVDACRSRKADVPGHGVIRLAKFASMGSALTFPFEALVFSTIVFMAIESELSHQLTTKDIKSLRSRVRIYGDDIIVPVEYAEAVTAHLQAFGLKVNIGKSFWNGKFRESCGKEYYGGVDVSVTRFRRMFPAGQRDVPEVVSLVEFRNQMYYAGMWKTTKWLDDVIGELLPHYPYVASTSTVLGRYSFLGYETQRMSSELQSPQVRGYVVRSSPPPSTVSGEGSLLKWFLKRSDEPFADRDHLERAGRPQSSHMKLRYAQPF